METIKFRPNYKTKIHATQTLNKYRRYEEYGDAFFDVFSMAIKSLKELSETRDDTEYKYVESLEEDLLNLLLHLTKCAVNSEESILKMDKFLKDHLVELKDSVLSYCKEKGPHDFPDFKGDKTTSSQDSTHEGYEETLLDNPRHEITIQGSEKLKRATTTTLNPDTTLMRNLGKVKEILILLRDYIENSESIKIPFDIFQKLHEVADLPIEEFANLSK